MDKELTIEDVVGKMSWLEVMRQYDPNITEDAANYILWNETCFPFDNKVTLIQIKSFFTKQKLTHVR